MPDQDFNLLNDTPQYSALCASSDALAAKKVQIVSKYTTLGDEFIANGKSATYLTLVEEYNALTAQAQVILAAGKVVRTAAFEDRKANGTPKQKLIATTALLHGPR